MEGRYIKIWEKLRDSKHWPVGEKFTKLDIWLDMLFMANLSDKEWNGVLIKRGHFVASIRKLAKRWRWSYGSLSRHFLDLELDHQVVRHKYPNFIILEIVNYDMYNPIGSLSGSLSGSKTGSDMETTKYNINIKGSRKKEVELSKKALGLNPELELILQHCARYLNLEEFSPKDIQMLRDLLEKYGQQMVLDRIRIASEIRNDDFAPVVTSVQNLRDKWLNIEAHLSRKKSKEKKQHEELDGEPIEDLKKELGVVRNSFGKIIG